MICSSHPYLSCCLKRVAVTADADSLLSRAKSEPVKAACKKVFEALRYSDPVSASADELLTLIAERNKKSKAGK